MSPGIGFLVGVLASALLVLMLWLSRGEKAREVTPLQREIFAAMRRDLDATIARAKALGLEDLATRLHVLRWVTIEEVCGTPAKAREFFKLVLTSRLAVTSREPEAHFEMTTALCAIAFKVETMLLTMTIMSNDAPPRGEKGRGR